MRRRERTLEQLAAQTRTNPDVMATVLEGERQRGNVECVDGHYRATEQFLSRHGDAFRGIHRSRR